MNAGPRRHRAQRCRSSAITVSAAAIPHSPKVATRLPVLCTVSARLPMSRAAPVLALLSTSTPVNRPVGAGDLEVGGQLTQRHRRENGGEPPGDPSEQGQHAERPEQPERGCVHSALTHQGRRCVRKFMVTAQRFQWAG